MTSASLLARESDFGATLESFFAYDDDFVATFGGTKWSALALEDGFEGTFG